MLIILPDAVETAIFTVRGMTIRRLQLCAFHGRDLRYRPYGNGYFAAMHTNHVKRTAGFRKGFDFIEVFNNHISDEANKWLWNLQKGSRSPGLQARILTLCVL